MTRLEKDMILSYLSCQLSRYENEERQLLENIRFRRSDSVDCFELARAKDNRIMFLQFSKDVMNLLRLYDEADKLK